MKRKIALAVTAVFILGGCSAEEATKDTTSSTSSAPAASSAPTAGCTVEETEELYVTQMYDCPSRGTKVYLFNTSSARDSYRKVAEEFGSVVAGQGDTWLEVKA